MMLFPAFVGNFAARTQRFTDIAEFEVTGKVTSSRYPPDEPSGTEIFERMKQLLQEDTDRLRADAARGFETINEQVRETIETGGAYAVILTASSPTHKGFESLLLSYITAAWTIFETLAGDIWEFAINENPNLLAQLSGKANRLRKSRKPINFDRNSDATESNKTVRLSMLQLHQWDLSRKMGSVLKNRFEFARLEGIREAYASAFSEKENSDDIDNALSDEALDIISVLRNVIVHRNGIADREYVDRCAYILALPKACEGEPIAFDGQLVAHVIGEMLFCAARLFDAVDAWIAKRATPP